VVPSFTPISSRGGDIFTLHLRGDIIIVQQHTDEKDLDNKRWNC
jgi:hypothetical protein